MSNINKNFLKLKESYLFSEIANRKKTYLEKFPDKKIISLGIGDVTLPLPKVCTNAMKRAVWEMSLKSSFKGYGPEQGYSFLTEEICTDYTKYNIKLDSDEIFISDGVKSDIANITDLFSKDNTVLVPDPVYPVYVDTNIMNGRQIEYIDGNESNNFLPMPNNKKHVDIIYLCSPNNPTGSVYNKNQLKVWVDYALDNKAVILFDSAYHCYIKDKDIPKSIYEIEDAKKCSIEFCSFSKNAGFTGMRCGYTIIPKELIIDNSSINKLWLRRQCTKFNGVSYITQRAAQAIFSEEGNNQVQTMIKYYMDNAKTITDFLESKNIYYTGGINAPYIWLKCPDNINSWEFFDLLLNKANVVGTPGVGFGDNGEGYFRLTAFGDKNDTDEAIKRLNDIL